MKTIGIKLADGSFYPVLQEGEAGEAKLDLTTAHNNQTRIMVDLYRSATSSMDDAEYVDTLQIDHLKEHPNGEPDISFIVSIDDNKELSAKIVDPETGAQSDTTITLVSRTLEERLITDDYDISKQTEPEPVEEQPDELILPDFEESTEATPETTETPEAPADETIVETADEPVEEEPEVVDSFEPEIAETAVGAGLLATAMAMQEDMTETQEETVTEEPVAEIADEPAAEIPEDFSDEPIMPEDELVLPDFEESPDVFAEDDVPTEETPVSTDESLDLPSLDDFDSTPAAEDDFQLPPIENELDSSSIDFDIPEVETTIFDEDEDDFSLDHILDAQTDESLPVDTGLTDGLYDENGEFADDEDEFSEEEEEVSKKTRTPVIICILCAIICILATCLILFVIPSKYNLLGKTKTETKVEVVVEPEEPAPVIEEPAPEPEPEIPAAVEDEIIVIEKAEEVLPEPPAPPVKEPEDITYKIKWGDTLWDIADTYYKNPWRYHKIAKYNGIKDPDYIISGTIIKIPVE